MLASAYLFPLRIKRKPALPDFVQTVRAVTCTGRNFDFHHPNEIVWRQFTPSEQFQWFQFAIWQHCEPFFHWCVNQLTGLLSDNQWLDAARLCVEHGCVEFFRHLYEFISEPNRVGLFQSVLDRNRHLMLGFMLQQSNNIFQLVNQQVTDTDYLYPWFLTVKRGFVESFFVLLQHRSDIDLDQVDPKSGQTLLHLSAEQPVLLSYLMSRGANIFQPNTKGLSAVTCWSRQLLQGNRHAPPTVEIASIWLNYCPSVWHMPWIQLDEESHVACSIWQWLQENDAMLLTQIQLQALVWSVSLLESWHDRFGSGDDWL